MFFLGMNGDDLLPVHVFTSCAGGLPPQEVTFAQLAKEKGYRTALLGTRCGVKRNFAVQVTFAATHMLPVCHVNIMTVTWFPDYSAVLQYEFHIRQICY